MYQKGSQTDNSYYCIIIFQKSKLSMNMCQATSSIILLTILTIILENRFQDVARKFDKLLYPEEPDVPGLTFLTPIEWAPWMETIWYWSLCFCIFICNFSFLFFFHFFFFQYIYFPNKSYISLPLFHLSI